MIQISGPPSAAERRGQGSSGVGRWASRTRGSASIRACERRPGAVGPGHDWQASPAPLSPSHPRRRAKVAKASCPSCRTSRSTSRRSSGAILGQPLLGVRLASPSLLRTALPPIGSAAGRRVRELRRIGKRIALGLEPGARRRRALARAASDDRRPAALERAGARSSPAATRSPRFDFADGTLTLTEAGAKKRASLHVVADEAGARRARSRAASSRSTPTSPRLPRRSRARTIRSSARSPTRACSAASATPIRTRSCTARRLSPLAMSAKLTRRRRPCACTRRPAPRSTDWIELPAPALRRRASPRRSPPSGPRWRCTASTKQPCPVCGTAVQRIRYADNETNYCPRCQTEGRLLADRGLSRLLKRDWPRTIDELERLRR